MSATLTERVYAQDGCSAEQLKAPFPYMGGKSRVAHIVWKAFGDAPNYVEPFFGSGAVLLGRPHEPKIETVNDADALLSNFWRSIKAAPDDVAKHADWPVNECDLHARHLWLVEQRETLTARLHGDPEYYDAKLAGWWVWGCCSSIGGGWCSGEGPWGAVEDDEGHRQLVRLGNAGQGIERKRVHLNACMGINSKRVQIADWFGALADRLRDVRVCCGDWSRIMGPTPTEKNGVTAVFLDPPYGEAANRRDCYAIDSRSVADDVLAWCRQNGDNRMLRIALCGYEGEHDTLVDAGWTVHAWKAPGGYGSRGSGQGRENAHRERIWFSPHCLSLEPKQRGLFE